MKKFLWRVSFFSLPFCVVCVFFVYILLITGEIGNKELYVKPLKESQLLGLAYSEPDAAYKYAMTDEIFQPEVLALGSSRIAQVQRNVINPQYSFYNAGRGAQHIYDYRYFLNKLHYTPRFLIIDIEQFYFDRNFLVQKDEFRADLWEFPRPNWFDLVSDLWTSIREGKIDFRKIFSNESKSIGLNGIVNQNGFRFDGSHLLANQRNNPKYFDWNFVDTYDRIDKAYKGFQRCQKADRSDLEEIDALLKECEEKQIPVLAIIPPFAPLVWQRIQNTGELNYMSEIYGLLNPIFKRHSHCYIYDYTDVSSLEVHNYDFIDGIHGSELVYNNILKDVLLKNSFLQQYFVDIATIDRIDSIYNSCNIKYNEFE